MPTQTIGAQHAQELQDIADSICRSCQVLMVTGAGISTNSGIPDFRSANGLYNLVKRRYPEQTALLKGKDLFDAISFTNPITTAILYSFLAELRQNVKGITDSTPTHKFIKTLSETGRLLRCYTQNIDGLEALDGLCMDISRGAGKRGKGKEKIGRETGCEVVQLHGDLEMLRCTQCTKLHDYDEERVETLLGGEAPECPDCSRKADDRLAAGKRSINVGTLRPNIVLYDELHPQGEAIGQITHYDATRMAPDLLLIFGTSLKVIGLKRIVKAFASKVKARGGKVLYINATPAADSIWGDVIDYHIQMDCDAWIQDLKLRRKEIWLHQSLLDKEWRKTKPSLLKSKTTGYESDKENSEKLKGHPLVRRKSLSSLPSKKKAGGGGKEKQLPTPTNTPRKRKPSSAPNTPVLSASKRAHVAAFPPASSPLTSLGTTPACSYLNTPSKRMRIANNSLPLMNPTTSPHHHRIQDLRTPQRASAGSYKWTTVPDKCSTNSISTPTQNNFLYTPERPIPDSPFLPEYDSDPTTPSRSKSRFFLDYIAVPPIVDIPPSSPPHKLRADELSSEFEPSTPRRPARSEISCLTNSISRSVSRHQLHLDQIVTDEASSPVPTPTRHRPYSALQMVPQNGFSGAEKQIPTPPNSQTPSDLDQVSSSLGELSGGDDDDVKYRPRVRNSKRRAFMDEIECRIERLEDELISSAHSEATEVDEQLERELGMARTPFAETVGLTEENVKAEDDEDEIEDVDLVPSGNLATESEPGEQAEKCDNACSDAPTEESPWVAPETPSVSIQDLGTPISLYLTPKPINKTRRKTLSPTILGTIERRRTRGLEKDEAILKELNKPGTVTRREADRRKSLKAEFKGLV
ncbi:hypothetical protein TWF730_011170 [Orbilia blumenaviensis]|uniref:Deacetylase sirtuin-type domain-containing protein n=1 Tax=Orbilia blumenaviensis TaxID=1796055 RepID=A0AAV9UKI9_9PEZI